LYFPSNLCLVRSFFIFPSLSRGGVASPRNYHTTQFLLCIVDPFHLIPHSYASMVAIQPLPQNFWFHLSLFFFSIEPTCCRRALAVVASHWQFIICSPISHCELKKNLKPTSIEHSQTNYLKVILIFSCSINLMDL
jgi:hypothetical protein